MSPARYRVDWTDVAIQDVYVIIDFIRENDPLNAASILEKMKSKAESLEFSPTRGRIVPELEAHGTRDIRELILGVWRIIYAIRDEAVEILAVVDSRRDLEDVLMFRFMRPAEGE